MRQLVWAAAFLAFDRESGRVRPGAITGITVVALAVASHVVLAEPWMEQAGFPATAHASTGAGPSLAPVADCRTEAGRP